MPESSWRFFLTFMVAAAEVLVGAASSLRPCQKSTRQKN